MFRRAALLFCLVLFTPTLAAAPLDEGLSAYDSGDYRRAFSLLEPLAKAGDPLAQLKLGLLYYMGNGVAEDEKAGVEWMKRSAGQGNADAMYHLGVAFTFGSQTPKFTQDADVEAAKWYFEAARIGHKEAQYALGLMFLAGKGVVQSQEEAAVWIRKAAEQGHPGAQSFVRGIQAEAGRQQ